MSAALRSGPLPDDIEEAVASIMREEGVSSLTSKVLRQRLEQRYRIEFTSHKDAMDNIIRKLMQRPEFQKQLRQAVRAEAAASEMGGKGKKRSPKRGGDDGNSKRSKKTKPENYPKRALTAYFCFAQDHRDKVKAENPDMKSTEIVQRLAKMWAEASDAVKEKYKRMAEKDKERYNLELSKYQNECGPDSEHADGKTKRKTHKKDEHAPKRFMTAYIFFSNDFRKKNPTLSVVELSKAAGAAWKELSEEMKRPYKDMEREDRERYQREMAERAS